MQISLLLGITLRDDIRDNDSLSQGEMSMFSCNNHGLDAKILSCDKENIAFMLLLY